LQRVAPQFVADAIIADARADQNGYLTFIDVRRDDDRSFLRRGRTARAKDSRDLELRPFAAFDEILRLHSKSFGDTVKPPDGHCPRTGFEAADRLGSGRRIATPRDIVESQPTRSPNFPNACDHCQLPAQKRTNKVFVMSYTFAAVASEGQLYT
jgi:hypothetical protein